MSSIVQRETQVIEDMSELEDQLLCYEYLMSFIDMEGELPEAECNEEHRVSSCSARAWIKVEYAQDGRLKMTGTSDALVTRALIGLIASLVNGASCEEIQAWTPRFLHHRVFRRFANQDRKAGLEEILSRIRAMRPHTEP